jgi:hypothetical protein
MPGALSSLTREMRYSNISYHRAQRRSPTCSTKLQQRTRDLAVPTVPIRDWLGMNGAQRDPLRHFASKGLGVRVTLAPPLVRAGLPLLGGCTFWSVQQKVQQPDPLLIF